MPVYRAMWKNFTRFRREGLGADLRQGLDALRRAILCRILRNFSASVQPDVRPRWRGRRESDSQVFCHLDSMHEDSDVQHGRVRLEDQLGNAEADTAADLGRRDQSEVLIDAWRRLLKV